VPFIAGNGAGFYHSLKGRRRIVGNEKEKEGQSPLRGDGMSDEEAAPGQQHPEIAFAYLTPMTERGVTRPSRLFVFLGLGPSGLDCFSRKCATRKYNDPMCMPHFWQPVASS
jgi:hypothetical protein